MSDIFIEEMDIDFPKYNPKNTLHKEISVMGKNMEEKAKKIVEENKDDSRVTLQRKILENLKEDYEKLTNLVLKLFGVKK